MWKLTFRKGSVELTEFSENSFREFLVQEKMLNNILFRFLGFRVNINVTSELDKAS